MTFSMPRQAVPAGFGGKSASRRDLDPIAGRETTCVNRNLFSKGANLGDYPVVACQRIFTQPKRMLSCHEH
jgi:hypothetical protein